MKKIIILDAARKEYFDAKAYYEQDDPTLGLLFELQIMKSLQLIREFPEGWQKETSHIRRFVLRKFPYKILYRINGDIIAVLAFAHMHRNPDYWQTTK